MSPVAAGFSEVTLDDLGFLRPIAAGIAGLAFFDIVGQFVVAVFPLMPGDGAWRANAFPLLIAQLTPVVLATAVATFAASGSASGLRLVGVLMTVLVFVFGGGSVMLLRDAPPVIQNGVLAEAEVFRRTVAISLIAGTLGAIGFVPAAYSMFRSAKARLAA